MFKYVVTFISTTFIIILWIYWDYQDYCKTVLEKNKEPFSIPWFLVLLCWLLMFQFHYDLFSLYL